MLSHDLVTNTASVKHFLGCYYF